MKLLPYIIIVALIIAILWICNKQRPSAPDTIQPYKDTLEVLRERHNQDSVEYAAKIAELANDRNELLETNKILNAGATKLEITNTKLRQAYTEAKSHKDTIQIFALCDSCFDQLHADSALIDMYVRHSDSLIKQSEREVGVRDAEITRLDAQSYEYETIAQVLATKYDKLVAATVPRNSIWAGGKISGNAINPLGQVGVFGMLQNKSGKQFGIGTGLQLNGGWYVEGMVAVKISLKRK